YLADSNGSPFCTATLIDNDVAITAQHCIEGTYPVESMRFGMGDPSNPRALIPVHSAPYHGTRDVALLLLQQDAVSLVPEAEPLPFLRSQPDQSLVGTSVEAAGYGQTNNGEDGRFFVTVELTEIQADWLVVNGWGQQGICFGDSGGPLLIHVDNGEPVIAGVESHGDSSCLDQDFETRLDMATDWIDQQMGNFN
ncbi:MAG: S1 family peptidase, partial [Myxococcales bacterium]|nr:S1 family peptidase [Myxococcales bacterium]